MKKTYKFHNVTMTIETFRPKWYHWLFLALIPSAIVIWALLKY